MTYILHRSDKPDFNNRFVEEQLHGIGYAPGEGMAALAESDSVRLPSLKKNIDGVCRPKQRSVPVPYCFFMILTC